MFWINVKSADARKLTFCRHIIDQYDHLAPRVIFMHAGRYQWHNDDPRYGLPQILLSICSLTN